MSVSCAAFRRPSEPQAIEVVFDRSICLVRVRRHRRARRYTLRIPAATREVSPHDSAARHAERGARVAREHGGWMRRGSAGCPSGALRPRRGRSRCAAWRIASPIAARRAAPSGRVDESGERFLLCVARRCAACRSTRRRFSPSRGQARTRGREPAVRRRAWRRRPAASRCAIRRAVGVLLDRRRVVVFVAADPGAELRAQLPRRARSGAPGRDEPFGAVLAPGAAALPRSRTGQGVARRSWQRSASLRAAANSGVGRSAVVIARSHSAFTPVFDGLWRRSDPLRCSWIASLRSQ